MSKFLLFGIFVEKSDWELKQLSNNKQSCVVEKTITQNLAIEPWSLGNLKEAIKNLLDFKIGKFVKELNGILISFKNLRILQNVDAIKNDNSDVNFKVEADYFIFQPYIGATLAGIVSKKYLTHLVVILHRVFNVVIPRPTEQQGNTWLGLSVQENQEVIFKIVVLDLYGALPYIRGELDEKMTKVGHGSIDDSRQSDQNKTNEVTQQSNEKSGPVTRNQNISNKLKNNSPIDNNSVHRQMPSNGEIEVNLHSIKSKNRRHKDYGQKYCDSEIKQIDSKLKHIKHIDG